MRGAYLLNRQLQSGLPLLWCDEGERHRTAWLSGFSADLLPDFTNGLLAVTCEAENVRTICLRNFQFELGKKQRPACLRQIIKFNHDPASGTFKTAPLGVPYAV